MSTNALGLFDAPSTAIEAAGALKGAGFDSPTVISPIPLHGIDEVLGKKKSVIKRFTFFGALFGGIAGFSLAAGTAARGRLGVVTRPGTQGRQGRGRVREQT